ncbi:hypothetical protein OIO90_000186 [Microbotryomycetes sp. JL221]|nr:hypothetical protein OIO90_000186 [Microbotryomycetes sp. JL221]
MHTTQALLLLAAAGAASASYAPVTGPCPSNTTLIRNAGTPSGGNQTLNPQESSYVSARKSNADQALRTWFDRNNITSTVFAGNLSGDSTLPTIGIALSGGGNRAALFGAGALSAFDGRNSTSATRGLGGLLQSSTYVTGLSGGSWLLTSFVLNDMPQVYPMVLGDGTNTSAVGWNLNFDFFSPSRDANISRAYQAGLFQDMAEKIGAPGGFNVTVGDAWARALAYHFVPGTNTENFYSNSSDHGASILWSSAKNVSTWQNNTLPFPIIVTDVYSVNTRDKPIVDAWVPLQNVGYEVSPIEFGSYDPELASFVPTEYMGSSLTNGQADTCVTNFDNAGFITGCSSNVFYAYNVSDNIAWTNPASPINLLWTTINATFGAQQPNQQLDISAVPNSFQGLNPGMYEDSNETQLRLVDGGYDGQVVPLEPLLVRERNVEVIFAIDATADSDEQQPTGASMSASEFRVSLLGDAVSIAPLPNSNVTWVEQGLNTRPVFFGCNGTNATLQQGQTVESPYAMLVYLPNFDPTGVTNTSTGQLTYNDTQATSFLNTAVDIVTRGLSNDTTEFATCVACAIVERARGRQGVNRTDTCNQCFAKYCWSEQDSSAPPAFQSNSTGNGNSTAGGETGTGSGNGGSSGGGNSTGSVGNGGSGGSGGSGGAPPSAGVALTVKSGAIGVVMAVALAILF